MEKCRDGRRGHAKVGQTELNRLHFIQEVLERIINQVEEPEIRIVSKAHGFEAFDPQLQHEV